MHRHWICQYCDAVNPVSGRVCHACGRPYPEAPPDTDASSQVANSRGDVGVALQPGNTRSVAASTTVPAPAPWAPPLGYPIPLSYAPGTGQGYVPGTRTGYAYPGGYGYYAPYGYAAVPVPVVPRREGLALASLVLGILSFGCSLLGIPAIVLGVAALLKISRERDDVTGSGMAVAGIAIGALSTLATVTILLVFINTPSPS